jgi:hypothetical protein
MKSILIWRLMYVMIYYLVDIDESAVKFGYTEPKNFRNRFTNIVVGNSGRLQVIATHSGNRDREKSIKKRFKPYHKQGEWYHCDPPVLDHIESVNDFEYFFDVFDDQLTEKIFDTFLYARLWDAYQKLRCSPKSYNVMSTDEWLEYIEDVKEIPKESVLPYIWN